jgi:hypothetical protein
VSTWPDRPLTAGEQRLLEEAPSGGDVSLEDLFGDDAVIGVDVLRGLCVGHHAKEVDPRGVRVRWARVVDVLDLSFCTVPHPLIFRDTTFEIWPVFQGASLPALAFIRCKLPGLAARDARVEGLLSLAKAEASDEIWLYRAAIGHLDCSGASLVKEAAVTLHADGARIGNVELGGGFSSRGEVRFAGTVIEQLNSSGARLENPDGVALALQGAHIADLFLTGTTVAGEVRLEAAEVGRTMSAVGATLGNEGRRALFAQGARIGGSANLRKLQATGGVSFFGARIGGHLDLREATLAHAGTALDLYGAEIGADALLSDGFAASGEVRLAAARIGGSLDLSNASLANEDGAALSAGDAAIGHALVLGHTRVSGGVDLYRASASTLDDDLGAGDDGLGSWSGAEPLDLEGFAYARFGDRAEWSPRPRLRWLRRTAGFQIGAWQQLVAAYRAQGRDGEATTAAVAMHDDRLARAGLPWHRRAGRWVLRLTVGHGYRPWLAGAWGLGIVALFALAVWLGSETFVAEGSAASGSPEPLVYAADTFLPVVDFGEAERWRPTGWLRWAEWLVILLGWALTTIFVAGFTRIVRT